MTLPFWFSTILAAFIGATSSSAIAATPIPASELQRFHDLGPAPATVRVRVAVMLKYHHDAELERLTEAQADPSSPIYHRFLSPSQFRSYFAPTAAEYARVGRALSRAGFAITGVFPNRTIVDAAAPAPVAARYFSTDIHKVWSPEAGLSYANVRAGLVPADIAGIVSTVIGLDDTAVFHAPHHMRVPTGAEHSRLDVRRNGYPLYGPEGGYGPQILSEAYDLPSLSGYTGTGRSIGIEMAGDFLDSDLATDLAYFGVTATGPPVTRVSVDGGAPPFPGGGADETTGDLQTIVSLAPGAAVYVYEIPALRDTPVVDVFNQVVSDNFVDTLNSSWGGWETQSHGELARSLEAIEKQGAAQGITFHAITGDWGSVCPYAKKIDVCLPGSTPHNIAVGGTDLAVDANGHVTDETGWNVPGAGATGGGVSVVFRLPSWQRNVPNAIAGGRNVPDLAFDASGQAGEAIYFNGAWTWFYGTSLASPIFGAALGEIDQVQNARAGYFNVTLYKTWLANGYSNGSTVYFRDIVQGSIPPYYAHAGYDQMSGIGALQAMNFVNLLHR